MFLCPCATLQQFPSAVVGSEANRACCAVNPVAPGARPDKKLSGEWRGTGRRIRELSPKQIYGLRIHLNDENRDNIAGLKVTENWIFRGIGSGRCETNWKLDFPRGPITGCTIHDRTHAHLITVAW